MYLQQISNITLTFLSAVEETPTVTVASLNPMSAALCHKELNQWDCSLSAQDEDLIKEGVVKREMILEERELLDLLSGHGM
jgi:hypothetical protein